MYAHEILQLLDTEEPLSDVDEENSEYEEMKSTDSDAMDTSCASDNGETWDNDNQEESKDSDVELNVGNSEDEERWDDGRETDSATNSTRQRVGEMNATVGARRRRGRGGMMVKKQIAPRTQQDKEWEK